LEAVDRGESLIQGFRDRDPRAPLFPEAATASPEEAGRRSAPVARRIGLLRAPGVIAEVAKTPRYRVTAEGRRPVGASLAARQAGIERWLKAAGDKGLEDLRAARSNRTLVERIMARSDNSGRVKPCDP